MNRLRSFWQRLKAAWTSDEEWVGSPATNFSPRAREVMRLARLEAERLHHGFIGTEHMLLGLLRGGPGVAFSALTQAGFDLGMIRAEMEKEIGVGSSVALVPPPPLTPRVKTVLALARQESKALHDAHVGTEHLLLGLLCEEDNVAARVLRKFGVTHAQMRQHILKQFEPRSPVP